MEVIIYLLLIDSIKMKIRYRIDDIKKRMKLLGQRHPAPAFTEDSLHTSALYLNIEGDNQKYEF